jgi:hypothetical protein
VLRIVVSQAGTVLGAGDYELGLIRIGSSEDNDLQVEHEDLSAHHAEVFLFGKRVYVRSPDDAPLQVDGSPIEGRAELSDGQSIEIGEFGFQVRLATKEASEQEDTKTYRSGRIKLKGTEMLALPGHEEQDQLILQPRRILIGRGATEGELTRLHVRGATLAQEIVDHHAQQGMNELAEEIWSSQPRKLTVAHNPNATSTYDPKRLVKFVLLTLLALTTGGILLLRVSELLQTFTR